MVDCLFWIVSSKQITKILNIEENINVDELRELTRDDIMYFKYTPIVSVLKLSNVNFQLTKLCR